MSPQRETTLSHQFRSADLEALLAGCALFGFAGRSGSSQVLSMNLFATERRRSLALMIASCEAPEAARDAQLQAILRTQGFSRRE